MRTSGARSSPRAPSCRAWERSSIEDSSQFVAVPARCPHSLGGLVPLPPDAPSGIRPGPSAPPGSAQAGGIRIGAIQVKVFLISGVCRLVGMQQPLNEVRSCRTTRRCRVQRVAVAFLARNNPIGIIFAAIVWSVLSRGDTAVQLGTPDCLRIRHHLPGHPDHVGRDRVQ